MLSAFANAFRTPDLRRKILFVLGIILLFRIGSTMPAPGIDVANVRECVDIASQGENSSLFALINVFSGGALLQLTVFALGIMPYITASIILQLLVVVIPRLEALKKEGQAGQTKITQYTRYLTLGLAILQATGIVALARSGQLFGGAECGDLHVQQRLHRAVPADRAHDGLGHRGHHVARRAHHRPRHRQRHVDPHLHPGRRHLPGRAVAHQDAEGLDDVHHRADGRARGGRRRDLHRAGAAPYPGAVRQADGRTPDVRRVLDVHPAEGQPGRHHPGHLRLQPDVPAGAVLAVPARGTGLPVRQRVPREGRPSALHGAVLRDDHLLHVLLRRDHLQPRRSRRQHEEVRRLHPGHPGRPADAGLPRLRAEPHHRARARSTSASSR